MKLTKSGLPHAHSSAHAKARERDALPPLELALSNISTALLALDVAMRATGYDLATVLDELAKFEQWCETRKRES